MIGAIAGDMIGSPYEAEGKQIKTEDFELFTEESHFTDDTLMTLAVGEALLNALGPDAEPGRYLDDEDDDDEEEDDDEENGDDEEGDDSRIGHELIFDEFTGTLVGGEPPKIVPPDEEVFRRELIRSMQRLGRKYPNAGFGGNFLHWIYEDDPKPYGSYGNGAAMRVSPIAWYFNEMDVVRRLARVSASVSHDHPEGIKGAEATAAAILLGRMGAPKEAIKGYIEQEFGYDLDHTVEEIRPGYQFDVSCQGSVPQAMICFLEGESFEDTVRMAVSLGGDSDTIAAIAGSIAEPEFPVPAYIAYEVITRLDDDLEELYATEEDHAGWIERLPVY
ncbi:MAG: ADP-ribosylglycohydrolase family protein [Anaerovoracaceae bacterium]|jgi:ADP-ribosylglycohydrolase